MWTSKSCYHIVVETNGLRRRGWLSQLSVAAEGGYSESCGSGRSKALRSQGANQGSGAQFGTSLFTRDLNLIVSVQVVAVCNVSNVPDFLLDLLHKLEGRSDRHFFFFVVAVAFPGRQVDILFPNHRPRLPFWHPFVH